MKQSFAKRMILLTVILMDLLAGTEFDLFVPSFPELQSQFNQSPFWIESLLSVNFIGYCLSLFFVGSLTDRYGRKPIILTGLTTFLMGTMLCILAPAYIFLLVGRFFQGIGVAAPAILSFLIIADSYPLKQQQSLFAILNGVMNISAGIAPVVGSYITLYFHWQGNFIALLALGLLALSLTIIFVPSYPLSVPQRDTSPYGYLSIFKSQPLMLLVVHFIFNFVPYWIFVGMSPLLYMEDLGVSLSHFGYYQGALAFIFALGSLLFGMVVNRYDHRKLLSLSNQIFMLGLITVAAITFLHVPNPLLITIAFVPYIIGQIIPSSILYPVCLNFMPEAKGRVAALLQGGRLIFSALSLQIAGYFYQGSFQPIGMIMMSFIFMAIVTLAMVIRHRQLIKI